MKEFVDRYRNASLLAAVLFLQFVLLGYQVKTGEDVRFARAWTSALITPIERILSGGAGIFGSLWSEYVWLQEIRDENKELKAKNERLRLEKQQLHRALARFSREEEVLAYQKQIPSQTVLASVIGMGMNPTAREIIIDQGRNAGIKPGMAVVTADGAVGKVQGAYGSSSLVLLISDVDSGVGVLLKNSRARGIVKGTGGSECRLEYIDAEVEVAVGEAVYTSGEDRIFPKGLPVGEVTRVGAVSDYQEIHMRPFAALNRLEEVLVVTVGVHQNLPSFTTPQPPEAMMPMPMAASDALSSTPPREGLGLVEKTSQATATAETGTDRPIPTQTEADALMETYRALGAAQQHRFGEGNLQTPPPDFNLLRPAASAPRPSPAAAEPETPTAAPTPVATEALAASRTEGASDNGAEDVNGADPNP